MSPFMYSLVLHFASWSTRISAVEVRKDRKRIEKIVCVFVGIIYEG